MSKISQIHDLLKSIETGEPGPVAVVNEARYVQHNPQTQEGSEGLAELFLRLSKTGPRVKMVRGFEDDQFVFAHMEYDFSKPKVCFEVFRFEDGQAVEHWDNIQEDQVPYASGHTMMDGPVKVSDPGMTEQSRDIAGNFVATVLVGAAFDRIAEFVSDAGFIEHNPQRADGVENLATALSARDASGRVTEYHTLHRVLAEGEFALCVSEGTFQGKHTAFYDLFRCHDGKIVEHWDTIETVAPRHEWKNSNGKF